MKEQKCFLSHYLKLPSTGLTDRDMIAVVNKGIACTHGDKKCILPRISSKLNYSRIHPDVIFVPFVREIKLYIHFKCAKDFYSVRDRHILLVEGAVGYQVLFFVFFVAHFNIVF